MHILMVYWPSILRYTTTVISMKNMRRITTVAALDVVLKEGELQTE